MIDTYIKKIATITKRGDAREESYYPALAALLEEFSETQRKKKAHVTVRRRRLKQAIQTSEFGTASTLKLDTLKRNRPKRISMKSRPPTN